MPTSAVAWNTRGRFIFTCALVVCTGCLGAPSKTVAATDKSARRPDGVVLELEAARLPPVDRAPSEVVVALRQPIPDAEVEETIRAYVRAFEREDMDALEQLVARDAVPLGRPGGRSQLLELWRWRMTNFDYQRLAGLEIVRFGQVERHTYDALAEGALGTFSRAPSRPAEMGPSDLYVRVPMAVSRAGGEQLFGDVVVLLLRREDGRLKIRGQTDESAR